MPGSDVVASSQASPDNPSSNAPTDAHPVLRMRRHEGFVVVQPWWKGKPSGESFSCDLDTGTVALSEHPPIEVGYENIYGVLGMATFDAGPALVVIDGVAAAGELRGHPLLRVTSTKVLHCARSGKWKGDDLKQLALLRAGTDPNRFGSSLFFASGGDATLTQQRYQEAMDTSPDGVSSAWSRADSEFCWNAVLAKPLINAGLEKFVPTMFMGFVAQLDGLNFSKGDAAGNGARIMLIARRSVHRAGTRQWRRGVDRDGHVANFVESEQLVEFPGSDVCASFVQVRGSIPLFWSQTPNLKYKIPIHIAAQTKNEKIIVSHFSKLGEKYGHVTAINLANQTGREGRLSNCYSGAASVVGGEISTFRFVPFDFHKHCGATKYDNLALLWKEVEEDARRNGFWMRVGGAIARSQIGVFRTNCIDTLDRTNVVQGMLARHALEALLKERELLSDGESLAVAFPHIEKAFRIIWADHGDEISRQYAGTGAMKSAFTRTGKRDFAGLIDDGTKSLTRYFLNNFRDGEKQDAIDLVTIGTQSNRQFRRSLSQGSPAMPVAVAIAIAAIAIRNAQSMSFGDSFSSAKEFLMSVALPLMVAAAIIRLVFAFGDRLVDRPVLRPELAMPWTS